MKINLGKKICELRRRDHKRQEDLANALGVTSQAVSRWETEGSYPDLELLPSIARFFGVTIDELFGDQSERARKVDDCFERIQTMNRENDGIDVSMDACIELARESLLQFPGEPKLVYALASVLYNAGYVRHGEFHLTDEEGYDIYDVERHRAYAEWREAIELYEKALEGLENGPLRDRAVRELIQLCANTGDIERAEAVVQTSAEMTVCREFLRLNSCDGKERAKRYGEAILTVAHHLAHLIVSAVMVNSGILPPEASVEAIRGAISVYEAVCTDGHCGVYHGALAQVHLYLSEFLWLAGDGEGAFSALDDALEHARRFDALGGETEAAYTAPLLRGVEVHKERETGISASLPQDWPWWAVPDCSRVKAEMQNDPRWADWAKRCERME